MVDSIFQKLEYEAFRAWVPARTTQSRAWFQKKIKLMGDINRQTLLKDPALIKKQRFGPGNMYMFFYDPKHKKTLPYYDAFPLTIMVDRAPGGFYGLNLHYVAPPLRAKLMDALMDTATNKRFDENTKFKINYGILNSASKMAAFKPCFKHYLTKHVDSSIAMVESPEWEIAVFMPTQQFRKARASKVWADSKGMI